MDDHKDNRDHDYHGRVNKLSKPKTPCFKRDISLLPPNLNYVERRMLFVPCGHIKKGGCFCAVPESYLQNELEGSEETTGEQDSRVVLDRLDSNGRRGCFSGRCSSGRGDLASGRSGNRAIGSSSAGRRSGGGGRGRRSRISSGGILSTALSFLLTLRLAVRIIGVVVDALTVGGFADVEWQGRDVFRGIRNSAVRADARERQGGLCYRCQLILDPTIIREKRTYRIALISASRSTADLRADVALTSTPLSFDRHQYRIAY